MSSATSTAMLFLVVLTTNVHVTSGLDRARICQIRCSRGMGGAYCQCSSAHFAGKRSGGQEDFVEDNLINNAMDISQAYFQTNPAANEEEKEEKSHSTVFVLSPVTLSDDGPTSEYFSTNPPTDSIPKLRPNKENPVVAAGGSSVQFKGSNPESPVFDRGTTGDLGNIGDDSFTSNVLRQEGPSMTWARLPLLILRDGLSSDPSNNNRMLPVGYLTNNNEPQRTSLHQQNHTLSSNLIRDKKFTFLLRKMLGLHGDHPGLNSGVHVAGKRFSHLLRQMMDY